MTKNVGIIQTKKSIADAFRRCCENRKSYYGNSDNWDYDGYAEESALVTYFMTAYKDCSINPQNVTLLQNVNVMNHILIYLKNISMRKFVIFIICVNF